MNDMSALVGTLQCVVSTGLYLFTYSPKSLNTWTYAVKGDVYFVVNVENAKMLWRNPSHHMISLLLTQHGIKHAYTDELSSFLEPLDP